MKRRTTIEIDDDLLARARKALDAPTVRATIEEALRRVVAAGEATSDARTARQRTYFHQLAEHADLEVLISEEMWR